MSVSGDAADVLESLELEVSQNGRVAAIGTVSTQAQSTLFEVFGPDNKVEITSSQHLFDIPPSEQQQIVTQQSGLMDLRVRARVVRGEEAFDDHGHGVEPLDRYTGTNRYGSHRDGEGDPEGDKGGDDWARALVVDAITHFSSTVNGFTVNDFSNMHGGRFPDHDSHQTGRDVDFRFPGYNGSAAPGAEAAATMIGMLNDPTWGSMIQTFFVSYTDGDAFDSAIQSSGKAKYFKPDTTTEHWDHGHVRFWWP